MEEEEEAGGAAAFFPPSTCFKRGRFRMEGRFSTPADCFSSRTAARSKTSAFTLIAFWRSASFARSEAIISPGGGARSLALAFTPRDDEAFRFPDAGFKTFRPAARMASIKAFRSFDGGGSSPIIDWGIFGTSVGGGGASGASGTDPRSSAMGMWISGMAMGGAMGMPS